MNTCHLCQLSQPSLAQALLLFFLPTNPLLQQIQNAGNGTTSHIQIRLEGGFCFNFEMYGQAMEGLELSEADLEGATTGRADESLGQVCLWSFRGSLSLTACFSIANTLMGIM